MYSFFLINQGYNLVNNLSKLANTLFNVVVSYFTNTQLSASDQVEDLSDPVHFNFDLSNHLCSTLLHTSLNLVFLFLFHLALYRHVRLSISLHASKPLRTWQHLF